MTDVFVSYATEDAAGVHAVIDALSAEGWQVDHDPAAASATELYAPDDRAGSAGAVVVVWSADARNSDKVRSEAATALYKNKLVQVRIDSAAPPRPFDQIEVADLAGWSGSRDDAAWRAIAARVRGYAGAAGQDRPMVLRAIHSAGGAVRSAAAPARPQERTPPAARIPEPEPAEERGFAPLPDGGEPPPLVMPVVRRPDSRLTYGGSPKRSLPVAPAALLAMVAALGATAWFVDPMGWFRPAPSGQADSAAAPDPTELTAAPAFAGPAAPLSWEVVDRNSPTQIRAFLSVSPDDPSAETARSLLRVLDAQLWMTAVTVDTEAAYTDYLVGFPLGDGAGAMSEAALERLAEIGSERRLALTSIQRGLASLGLYDGVADGVANPKTVAAIAAFAKRKGVDAPDPATAAPRDLRDFSDYLQSERIAPGAAAAEPAAVLAADAADRARLEAAQRATEAAEEAATDADALALRQLRASDDAAWQRARTSDSTAAYQAYLRTYPAGLHVEEARTELARPAPFSLDALSPELAAAAGAARRAQGAARERATAARDQAARATAIAASARNGVDGMAVVRSPQGDEYAAQVQDGALNGLGVRIDGGGATAGDRYSGGLKDGRSNGLGVYEFADNPNNARAGAARYEGEHANDLASGFGVTYWKNGDYLAGEADASGSGRGVITFANGNRYEGQLINGIRDGLGVVWSSSGEVLMAGRWENGALVEPVGDR